MMYRSLSAIVLLSCATPSDSASKPAPFDYSDDTTEDDGGGGGGSGGGGSSGGGSSGGGGGSSGGGGGSSGDPNSDADGDGFTLAEEQAAGTNPDYIYSRPYTGGYNVGFCDTPPEPTGTSGTGSYLDHTWPTLAMGDVPDNLTYMDQHGEAVDLYSFCGKHIMVVVSAGWCGPCRSLAESTQSIQDTYREDGLQIIEMLTNGNVQGTPPTSGFVQDWADEYNFDDIPVLLIPEPTSYTHPAFLFDRDAGIPSIYHLNEKMEVISADEGIHNPGYWL